MSLLVLAARTLTIDLRARRVCCFDECACRQHDRNVNLARTLTIDLRARRVCCFGVCLNRRGRTSRVRVCTSRNPPLSNSSQAALSVFFFAQLALTDCAHHFRFAMSPCRSHGVPHRSGADINARVGIGSNDFGMVGPPLVQAAVSGHLSVMNRLLDLGADPSVTVDTHRGQGSSLFVLLVNRGLGFFSGRTRELDEVIEKVRTRDVARLCVRGCAGACVRACVHAGPSERRRFPPRSLTQYASLTLISQPVVTFQALHSWRGSH